MRTLPIEQLPDHHRLLHGAFYGETEDGTKFVVSSSNQPRRMNSSELMRSAIGAQSKGKPMTTMYVDRQVLSLQVDRRHKKDIEILPNGYRHGRHVSRSLREVVNSMIEEFKPTPPASFGP